MEEYNFFSELYDAALQEHKKIYENDERALQLVSKQKDFYEKINTLRRMTTEYKETDNKEYLQLISDMYIKELKPLVNEIQQLRYEHSEIIVRVEDKGKYMDDFHNTLQQYIASIDNMDSFVRKQEKVVKYDV